MAGNQEISIDRYFLNKYKIYLMQLILLIRVVFCLRHSGNSKNTLFLVVLRIEMAKSGDFLDLEMLQNFYSFGSFRIRHIEDLQRKSLLNEYECDVI